MKTEGYRKNELLLFYRRRRRRKGAGIADRSERQTIQCCVSAARSQFDGDQRAVTSDSEADRRDPGEANPCGLARRYSCPELALIGRKHSLLFIFIVLSL